MSARKQTSPRGTVRKADQAPASRDFTGNSKDLPAGNPFAAAWESFKKTVINLATVDVTTFEGDVVIELSSDGKFKPSDFFDKLQASIADGSKLTLVAHTHVEFDLDSVVITKPEASAEVLAAHNLAVKTAVEARQAVIKLVKDLF